MADQLYLSYWLDRFRVENMLRRYEKMLRVFPFSQLAAQPSILRIQALDATLPPLVERVFEPPLEIGDIVSATREFLSSDASAELEAWWDLWQWGGGSDGTPEDGWKLLPARATLLCFGPDFDHGSDENLRVEFGVDTHFLPDPGLPNHLRIAQSNIRSLLKLTHDLDDALGGERRLWSESGENFAEKLQRIVAGE